LTDRGFLLLLLFTDGKAVNTRIRVDALNKKEKFRTMYHQAGLNMTVSGLGQLNECCCVKASLTSNQAEYPISSNGIFYDKEFCAQSSRGEGGLLKYDFRRQFWQEITS
jgi:hypothetical protein